MASKILRQKICQSRHLEHGENFHASGGVYNFDMAEIRHFPPCFGGIIDLDIRHSCAALGALRRSKNTQDIDMEERDNARREKRERREPKDDNGRNRLQYIAARLSELAAERAKLVEERKALRTKRKAERDKVELA